MSIGEQLFCSYVAGSSAGGIVYPIMLNELFHGSVGFAWGVRASGFLTLGLMMAADCMMRPRGAHRAVPQRKYGPHMKRILTDGTYMLAVAGCAQWLDT